MAGYHGPSCPLTTARISVVASTCLLKFSTFFNPQTLSEANRYFSLKCSINNAYDDLENVLLAILSKNE